MGFNFEDPLAAFRLDFRFPIIQRVSNALNVPTLAPHAHEVLLFALVYSSMYKLSRVVSPHIVSGYNQLDERNKSNFDMHVVSHVQSLWLCAASTPLFTKAAQLRLPNVGSYTPYTGFLIATATGYFMWDVWVSWKHRKQFGLGFVAHGVAAFLTFLLAFTPYMHSFAAPFMWFEASTPLVNIHWFATHVPGLISPQLQTINGLALIAVFFLARVVSGPYNGYLLFKESIFHKPAHIPWYTVAICLSTYATIMVLSCFWWSKMVRMAIHKFSGSADKKADKKVKKD